MRNYSSFHYYLKALRNRRNHMTEGAIMAEAVVRISIVGYVSVTKEAPS